MNSAIKREISDVAIEISPKTYYYSLYAAKRTAMEYKKTKDSKTMDKLLEYLRIASQHPTDKADIYGLLYFLCMEDRNIEYAEMYNNKAMQLLPNNHVLEYYKAVIEYNKNNLYDAYYWVNRSLEIGHIPGAKKLKKKIESDAR